MIWETIQNQTLSCEHARGTAGLLHSTCCPSLHCAALVPPPPSPMTRPETSQSYFNISHTVCKHWLCSRWDFCVPSEDAAFISLGWRLIAFSWWVQGSGQDFSTCVLHLHILSSLSASKLSLSNPLKAPSGPCIGPLIRHHPVKFFCHVL